LPKFESGDRNGQQPDTFEQQFEACLDRFRVGRVHGGPDFDGSHSDKRTAANEE
jgi:hypothetical protein